jgi:hypothetical protein
VADEPGIGELGRKIEDFRRDVRDDFATMSQQLSQFVLREVYKTDKDANELRLARLEREQENARNAARTALWAAIGSILATIIGGVILATILKGGGG